MQTSKRFVLTTIVRYCYQYHLRPTPPIAVQANMENVNVKLLLLAHYASQDTMWVLSNHK